MVGPATGFKLTLEMLRRKPDSALVWYEDFRDEEKIPESYWTVLSGEWDVWQDPDSTANRPYSQLEGYGQLAWNYDGFSDIHLRAQIIIPPDGGGKSGIFLGSLFLGINYDTQRLELYEGSTLKGSYLSNEGVSLLENAAHLGLPIPEKLKEVLEQLHDRGGKNDESA